MFYSLVNGSAVFATWQFSFTQNGKSLTRYAFNDTDKQVISNRLTKVNITPTITEVDQPPAALVTSLQGVSFANWTALDTYVKAFMAGTLQPTIGQQMADLQDAIQTLITTQLGGS